jgi:tetratricopeptide (TPR) repeat protein
MKQRFLLWFCVFLMLAALAGSVSISHRTKAPIVHTAAEEATGSIQKPRKTVTNRQRDAVSVLGVHEPDEMRVEPFPIATVEMTAPERELAEATDNLSKVNLPEMLPVLDRILAKYPDFAEGYVFRLHAFCEGNEPQKVMSDISNALKFMSTSRFMGTAGSLIKDTSAALLSMRAKLEYANGDYVAAMNGLEKVIQADLENATKFTNSGAAEPEKTASSVCVWAQPDMDALVQRFPTDYRSHMFRGLYLSFFVSFKPEDWIITRAIENFSKAAELNPKSALPQLFKARLLSHFFVFNSRLNKLGWSDAARDKLNAELVSEYTKALALDPNLLLALKGRANAYFNLKQFKRAIADYDRVLSVDVEDATSTHDRGLAKMLLDQNYEAISDFGAYIDLKRGSSSIEARNDAAHGYESRADAYMKTHQWNLAIRDLTTAISFQVGSGLILMNVDQFRALYPEYKSASNEMVAQKLHQTFYPNLKYEDFAKGLFGQRAWSSTVIPDLYVKRSDAYLKKGDWHRASIEFRRAINGFPDSTSYIDRWREIGETGGVRTYIDMKSFDDARSGSIKLWIKQARGASETIGAYELRRFELDCDATRIRIVSFANYDASGDLVGSSEGGRWGSVTPDTFGETLFNGACQLEVERKLGIPLLPEDKHEPSPEWGKAEIVDEEQQPAPVPPPKSVRTIRMDQNGKVKPKANRPVDLRPPLESFVR